jgi:hypothetical protein
MPSPSVLPLEARRAAWSRLWQVLLREPTNDDAEQQRAEPGSESAETNEATPRAELGKEVTTPIE